MSVLMWSLLVSFFNYPKFQCLKNVSLRFLSKNKFLALPNCIMFHENGKTGAMLQVPCNSHTMNTTDVHSGRGGPWPPPHTYMWFLVGEDLLKLLFFSKFTPILEPFPPPPSLTSRLTLLTPEENINEKVRTPTGEGGGGVVVLKKRQDSTCVAYL